jgi:hypothetical protein
MPAWLTAAMGIPASLGMFWAVWTIYKEDSTYD